LGFGASHSEWHLPDGGYLSIRMEVANFRAELVRYRLRMSASPWPRLRERVLAVWAIPAGTTVQEDGFPLTPQTQAALRKVESLPLEILTCSGCIVSSQTSAEALAVLREGGEK
jgi:hypothetical protein